MMHRCMHQNVRLRDLKHAGNSEPFGVSAKTIETEYIPQLRREIDSWALDALRGEPDGIVEGTDPCKRDQDGRIIYRLAYPTDPCDTEIRPSRKNPPDDGAAFIVALVVGLERGQNYWFVFRVCESAGNPTHFCVAHVAPAKEEGEWTVKVSAAAERGASPPACPDAGCCLCHAQDEQDEVITVGET